MLGLQVLLILADPSLMRVAIFCHEFDALAEMADSILAFLYRSLDLQLLFLFLELLGSVLAVRVRLCCEFIVPMVTDCGNSRVLSCLIGWLS